MYRLFTLLTVTFLFTYNHALSQCTDYATNGVDGGSLAFDGNPGTYQTQAITGQDYYTFSVSCGNVYYFDFCGNGGSTGGIFPVITVLDAALNVLAHGPYTGGCAQTSWAASFTGNIVVYITDDADGCTGAPAWTGTMAYDEAPASITYNTFDCNSATVTLAGNTGGTYSFNPVPGDGAAINSGTGAISGGTPGATYNVDYNEPTCGITLSTSVTLQPADATFSLTATSCSTATANITGTTGGTFAFNPAPGDGATIDPSTGAISNGNGGTTYNVDYTVCGATQNNSVSLPAGDASFTLTVVCGGGTVNVTGTTGGTFAFNPAPGDGAQINTSTGNVSNGTVGTTYFVEYTVCGTSSIESVTVLDDNCWTLNGDAQYINVGGEQCIQLTDEVNNQNGCAWNGTQIDFNQDFSLTLDYYFGDNIGGADGNTFTFQPSASTACGQSGEQMGAGGMTNTLSIEFDTYDNDNPAHVYDMACDHIAVEIDSDHTNAAPLCGAVCAKSSGANIDDGNVYTVDIQWDASTQDLEIYFDGALRLTCNNDFVTNAFAGSNMVYWGATSSTGGLNNQQYFCPSTIVILPVSLTSFGSYCNGEEEVFVWQTATEENTDYFQLEYTYDGLVFFPADFQEAMGNTSKTTEYRSVIPNTPGKQRYYRLKVVDRDGKFEYTDIISSKNCGDNDIVILSMEESLNTLTVQLSDEGSYTLLNSLGQVLVNATAQDQQFTIHKGEFSSGTYYLNVVRKDGMTETKKLFFNR